MSDDRRFVVLQRGKQESIYIGDDLQVVVVDIVGDLVRLGIEAPLSSMEDPVTESASVRDTSKQASGD